MSSLPFANRKQRRVAAKVERQTGGVLIDPGELESLHKMQRLFVGIIKEQGRVRVSEATLDGLKMGDRITAKFDDGSITVQFVGAEPDERHE